VAVTHGQRAGGQTAPETVVPVCPAGRHDGVTLTRDEPRLTGDRVAIRLPNGADWCLAFLGATLAGAIPVAVNTRLTPTEVEFIVRDSGASAVPSPARNSRCSAPRPPPGPGSSSSGVRR
jgi:hypothetical protein